MRGPGDNKEPSFMDEVSAEIPFSPTSSSVANTTLDRFVGRLRPANSSTRVSPMIWILGLQRDLALIALGLAVCASVVRTAEAQTPPAGDRPVVKIRVRVDRGRDLGQPFGSLFEATSDDGRVTIGAGFPNAYNTRLRGDRHALQFYVRENGRPRSYAVTPLPRPNQLCGTYLHSRDDQLLSTFGGLRVWNSNDSRWQDVPEVGGTQESMRIGRRLLEFGASRVRLDGREILGPPSEGEYQMFFYANGHLCFYHVNRRERAYRPYSNDQDGFSRLIACPWTPDDERVDLARATILNLPIVGETTFAWGVLGDEIVTGSNIGGFYSFRANAWKMLREPDRSTSFQLYSSLAYHDRLLMGQYPTGRLFSYKDRTLSEQSNWPPSPEGFSPHAREAQTTNVYAGDLVVGVWPWGELWQMDPHDERWTFVRRMFDHPVPHPDQVHPYEAENQQDAVPNLWGQRITSLIPLGSDLYVSTSAKSPVQWNAEDYGFLAPDGWQSYGMVYRLSAPGHLSVPTRWTDGPTELTFTIAAEQLLVEQDGEVLGRQVLGRDPSRNWHARSFRNIVWGQGLFGPARMAVEPLDEGTR